MKTSISLPVFLLGLFLSSLVCAQDQQDAEEAVPEETIETLSEPLQEETEGDAADPDESAAPEDVSAQDETASDAQAEDATDAGDDAQSGAAEAAAESQTPGDSAETFTFQGHPIFTPRTAELVYQPLVDYLNDALPYRFDLQIAPDYHRYWLAARRGENPHLVLEEPHLVSYRMERHDFTPLVQASEPITYSLLTSMNETDASVRDFIGQRVSTMPAPSLGYLILADWFDNPMQQPIIQSNAASWLGAVEIVFSGEADAAVVPHNLVSRYVNLQNVLTSREFPGVTVAASPEVPADIQEEIRDALLALHEDEEHFAALHELDIDEFVAAPAEVYDGLDEWLSLVYSVL